MNKSLFALLACLITLASCTKNSGKEDLWIYTSLYKDTIADIKPKLEKKFPNTNFHFFQAGSEEIAAKVNTESASNNVQADILISSDRFWYEEMAQQGKLHKYQSNLASDVPQALKNPDGYYSTLSIPVMVMVYNSDVLKPASAPKTFKEMMEPKWAGKFTTGSPLSSGTNFTTVSMLQHNYGWEYIQGLRKNETISQGGNSAVLRRIQSGERAVGWVLLENVLRFQDTDKRVKIIYPNDGVVLQSNVVAITNKKDRSRGKAEEVVDWLYGKDGQEAMIASYMYSPLEKYAPPKGAPPFSDIKAKSFAWTKEFIEKTVKERMQIKERFAEVMFH